MEVANHAFKHDCPFMMNLSAPFLSQFFKEPMMEAMPYVDVLIGNEIVSTGKQKWYRMCKYSLHLLHKNSLCGETFL
jgi:sugar/nucleoside kinase (ribokinase family)